MSRQRIIHSVLSSRLRMNCYFIFITLCLLSYLIEIEANQEIKTLCTLKTDDLIRYNGYDAETHTVETEDGYILTVFRCNARNSTVKRKRAVLLHHPLLCSSDVFCLGSPKQALAFIMADAGYDVWLTNARGNIYSRKHVFKNPDDPFSGFWDFSWYEIGIYDHPAVIEYVLEKTNDSKVFHIGFSQGATTLMVLLSERPEYNDKVYAASLLAPPGFLNHNNAIHNFIASFSSFLTPFPGMEIGATRNSGFDLGELICNDAKVCFDIFYAFSNTTMGPTERNWNQTMLHLLMCHEISGGSLKQLVHYGQLIEFGYFGKFKNGAKVPRDFPLSQITAPLGLHFSIYDSVIYPAIVDKLIPRLNNTKIYTHMITETKYNHGDILFRVETPSLVFTKVLEYFDMFRT